MFLKPEVKITLEQARTYWAMRQGLSTPFKGGIADVLRAAGWIYSAGSTLPYLAFRARLPGIDRVTIDRAIFDAESVLEVPTVRGCAMLVPAEDVSLALPGGRQFFTKYLEKIRKACNVTDREVRDLSTAIAALLKSSPMSKETLHERLPANLVRSFGSSGRSFGERSTLTYALRHLQSQAIVQRTASDHRLDSDLHTYRLLKPDLVKQLSQEEVENGLARRFFGWAAPATLKEFAWWAGISQKDARSIVRRIGLTSISVEGFAGEAWIPAEQVDSLRSARSGKNDTAFTLLPCRDNYLYFRRTLGAFLDAADRSAVVLDWMGNPASLGELNSLHHNAIVSSGRLVGYWEYDPEAGEIVWRTFSHTGSHAQREIKEKVAEMNKFIRSQLGDVAFYPFDRGKNRRQRIDSLK